MFNTLFRIICFWGVFFGEINLYAQEVNNQSIRGAVVDRATGNGIADAYIELLNYHPSITCVSQKDGTFKLLNVPVGHQRIRVIVEGYYEVAYPEFIVAGKESVLIIPLEDELETPLITVEKKGIKRKNKRQFRNSKMEAVDEMNSVSTRTINGQQIKKYVSSFGDPGRGITNFPGMFNVNDFQNSIISRGNSPYGIQWIIEGIPIDNPHHFALEGNTGGAFPLLNNYLLTNSDFANGALSAQYSNAYSGVFDVNLRKGNNQQHEFSARINTFAALTAEGPLRKGGASYVITFRTGILELLKLIGVNPIKNAIPHYYDLNFKLDFPTKKAGHFSVFGIGGLSDIATLDANRDTSDVFSTEGMNVYVKSKTGILGLKHIKFLNKQTSIKTTLSYQIKEYLSDTEIITNDTITPYDTQKKFYHRIGLSSIFNKKVSPKLLFRTGLHAYVTFYDIWDYSFVSSETTTVANEVQALFSGFAQVQYKFSKRFSLVFGVQGMYWTLNKKSWAVEPRLAFNWYVGKRHKLSLGYGWHSKIQSPFLVFHVERQIDGSYDNSNREIGPTRSHHIVLSYNLSLGKSWGIKANVYGQYNTAIPVEQSPSSESAINYLGSQIKPLTTWENTGEAYNYGAELSIEKFFSKGYYGLLTAAYQRAFYRGSDMVWRNSAFDVQYISSFLAGKEFKIGKKKRNIIYGDLRFNIRDGLPYTPIDLEASKLAGSEVLVTKEAYSERLEFYKRIDLRIGARFNHRRKRISHHIYIEVFNIANFRNEHEIAYISNERDVFRSTQLGILPNVFYEVEF
jgi:hypothetical protein